MQVKRSFVCLLATSLAEHIGKDIIRRCEIRLSLIDGRFDAKGMWSAVRQLTGRQ